jgi:hypothetical protein
VLLWFGRHPEVSTVFVSEFAGGENQQVLHWFADVEPIIPSGNNVPEAEVVGYLRAWEALPPSVKHIVVIRDTPKIHGDTLGCVERAIARRERAGLACAVRRSGALYPPDPAAAAAITLHSPRVQLVDLTPFLCDRLLCDPVIGGALVYGTHTISREPSPRHSGLISFSRSTGSWPWGELPVEDPHPLLRGPPMRCARAATRTSPTPPRCGALRSTLELADQEGVCFGHYDLNDFRFLGVRKRKLAEERRKAAVPGR